MEPRMNADQALRPVVVCDATETHTPCPQRVESLGLPPPTRDALGDKTAADQAKGIGTQMHAN
jgi:hypothetical protein